MRTSGGSRSRSTCDFADERARREVADHVCGAQPDLVRPRSGRAEAVIAVPARRQRASVLLAEPLSP